MTSIEVTRYRRPSPQSEKTLSNALITVRGVGPKGGELCCGYGEVPFRGQRTGGGISATWQFLKTAMAELELFPVDLSSADAARGSLVDLSARIRQFAEATGDGSIRPFAGARFAVETAFGDFAAKALQIGLGELLSGESHQASIVRPVRGYGANGRIRRESVERVLQTLSHSADFPIDLHGVLSYEQARKSLEGLIGVANSMEIAHSIVIHRPLRASQEDRLEELQEHLERVSSKTPLKPVLRLSQNLTWGVSAHVRPAQDVTIMPAASGGLVAAYEQIRALAANGVERIALVDADGSDSIGYAALKSLATSMPGITVVLRPRSGDGGHPEVYGHGGAPDWRRILEGYRENFGVGLAPRDPLELTNYAEAEAMRGLGERGVASALLQAEVLRRGSRTRRSSRRRFTALLDNEKLSFSSDGNRSAHIDEGNQTFSEQALVNALTDEGIPYFPNEQTDQNGDNGDRGFSHAGVKDVQHLSVLALGSKVLSTLERDPLIVVGDGSHTVAELLIRGPVSEKRELTHPWAAVDERVARSAVRYGVDLSSVPPTGKTIFLASSLSLARGATTREVLDDLPQELRGAIERALQAAQNYRVIRLDILVTSDPEHHDRRVAQLVAIDSAPVLAQFAYPLRGTPQDVVSPITRELLPVAGAECEGECSAIRISVKGKVTRVGYRAWAQQVAGKLSLTGWARNVTDERVEIVAAGPPMGLAILATKAIQGPARAHVDSVNTIAIEDPDVPSFTIVRKRPVAIARIGNDEKAN